MTTNTAPTPLVALNIPRPTQDPNTPANTALAQAKALQITTPEDYQGAAFILQDVKGRMKAIETARKALKQPLDAAVAAVQALFRPPQSTLEEAERIIKRKLADYDEAQRRAAQEAQRKLNEKAEKERQALQARAQKALQAGKGEKALELHERADAVTAPVVAANVPAVQGISYSTVWKFVVVDASQVPDEYKVVDESKVRAVVKSLGKQTNIPGVRIWSEQQVASRGA